MAEVWLTTGQVGLMAGVHRERVRQWARIGWITPTMAPNGWRLFRQEEIEEFLNTRFIETSRGRIYRPRRHERETCGACRGTGFVKPKSAAVGT